MQQRVLRIASTASGIVLTAYLVCACGPQPAAKASGSGSDAPGQASPPQSSADEDRTKENDDLKAKLRREHPDWSEQQIANYIRGYNSVSPISPETYAKTRAILDKARSLRCQFPRGSYVDLADPELGRHEGAGAEVTFDSIDRQRGHARVIAKNGAGDVTVISGPTALTFIEVADTGNPIVTVVFPRFRNGSREFYAADSERIFFFGDISIGQYYGSCTVLE
jgi:hypothetical protein